MSYQRIVTAPYQLDAASFQAWGSALCSAMEALGVTKTADTGQIDWGTVSYPTSANQYMGYEIRQFTDGLQATNPVIIKFEFGSSATSGQRPGIRITVGHTTDGAGNLTGDISSYFYVTTNAGSASLGSTYISSDGGRLNIAFWVDLSSQTNVFWIERFKDTNGDPTADGVNICANYTSSTVYTGTSAMQGLPASGAAYPSTPMKWQCAIPAGSSTYNENIGFFPVHPNLGYAGNPDLGGLMFYAAETDASGSFYTINIYGDDHQYVAVEYLSCGTNNTGASCSALVRCE
ncbi:MAG: hypothetical protein WC479_06975 [Candidatus Izemoplasmatales bacterium]